MTDRTDILHDLVVANRILAHEGVVDGFGHVSLRHPDRPECFLLARARSPELVEREDLLEFGPDGEPVRDDGPAPYLERFIHAAIYEARPDVQSVVHNHADELIPFGITDTKLRPVSQTTARIGAEIPVWDISEKFGNTNFLVKDMEQGRDLAAKLGGNRMVLMRSHGVSIAAPSLTLSVTSSIYAQRNARMQTQAMAMGTVRYLTEEEIAISVELSADRSAGADRTWEYYSRRAGADKL